MGQNTGKRRRTIIMESYQVTARNYSEASENKIHSDEIARRYGFRGALVPGVAVYGYLTYPLVARFGEAWLGQSDSSVRLLKPAYEGDRLEVAVTEEDRLFVARCHNAEGTLLAEMRTAPDALPAPHEQTVFDGAVKAPERVDMTWDNVVEGQPFTPWHWQITEDANRIQAERVGDDLSVYRHAGHPHWLLGIANRALTREYVMPAWIHVGSEIRFRSLLRVGDTVEVRAVPLEKWERKGHQFVKLYLAYHRGSVLTSELLHTAIFRVAE